MTTSFNRFMALSVFVLVPVIILWAFLFYSAPNRAEIPSMPPRWIDNYVCGVPSNDQAVEQNQPVVINGIRAEQLGKGIIENQPEMLKVSGGPIWGDPAELVKHQFPDGQSRLAWVYAEGKIDGRQVLGDKLTIFDVVYIDAMTGEPLLLLKDDSQPFDPNNCGLNGWVINGLDFQLIGWYLRGVGLTALYLLAVSVFIIVRVLRRRRQARVALAKTIL